MAGNEQNYKSYMSQGHSAAWDTDWDKAASFYQQALNASPDDAKATTSLANALFELEDFDKALELYQKVAQANPDDPLPLEKATHILEVQGHLKVAADAALRAAEIHLKAQDINRAIENWNECIRLAPENLKARTRLATVYEKQGRKKQAIAQYIAVASLLQHAGELGRATDLVQRAMRMDPANAEAEQALGLLRANQLLPKPAAKPVRRVHTRPRPEKVLPEPAPDIVTSSADPINEAVQKSLSAMAAVMFDADEADNTESGGFAAIQRQRSTNTGPLVNVQRNHEKIVKHLSQVVDLQSRANYKQAATELRRAIKTGLDLSSARFDLGWLYYSDEKIDNALKELQIAVNHPDYALAARLLIGKILNQKGRFHDSATQYLEALRVADSTIVGAEYTEELLHIYEPLIDSYAREKDESKHKNLSKAIEQLVLQKDWREKVSQARGQLPKPRLGIPVTPLAELLTQTEGGQVVEYMAEIHQMARRGSYRMAMEVAYQAIQYSPTYLPLHTFMGEILMQQDRHHDAAEKFNTVARAYSARGEAGRAIDLYRKITEMAPLDLVARQRLIDQLTATGKMDETVEEYLNLGDIYYRLAELEKARDTYQKALTIAQQAKLETWTVEILHHLADIDMQRLDWSQALKIYEQIVRIDPLDEKAFSGLVDLHFRMGHETEAMAALGNFTSYLNRSGQQDTALKVLDKMITNDPDQMALKRALAGQYKEMGRAQDAINIWDQIGDALASSGDISGAILAIQAILKLAPPNAHEYEQALQQLQAAQ